MTFRVRDSGESVSVRWVMKYSLHERVVHWGHTATFFALSGTGIVLFVPWFAPMAHGESGQLIRLIHRAAAVGFMLFPLYYLFAEPRRLWQNVKEWFTYDREDLLWLKALVPYYLLGHKGAMPPQGRFNTGEKANGAVLVLGTITFIVTGLIMWFGKFVVPTWLFQVSVILHDLAMIGTFNMFVIHMFLAVAHPLMWGGLVSMRFGVMSTDYIAEHHPKWLFGPEGAWRRYREARQAATQPLDADVAGGSSDAALGQR
ncbi:MAG: formate dehydrogenase subunit gamma [Anaerolineae bacterium]